MSRGALNVRVIVYGSLAAICFVVAYNVYVAWPRGESDTLGVMTAAGRTRLQQMRTEERGDSVAFVAPKPFVRPFQSTSIAVLEAAAARDEPDAQCELGIRYEHGDGVLQDTHQARSLFVAAAKKHNGCALNGLGNLYELGDGVGPDPVAAASFYRAAAAVRYPGAYFNLGRASENGSGLQVNDLFAYRWYAKAAAAGYQDAYDDVADRYADGSGVQQNPYLAERWYTLSADAGDAYAMERLVDLYLQYTSTPNHAALALYWLHKDRSPEASYRIGEIYLGGEGIPRDVTAATSWLQKSAASDYAPAEVAYADLLRAGTAGGGANASVIATYYEKAAAAGNATAMDRLAAMALTGQGMPKNVDLADRMLDKAARLGDTDAMLEIAEHYEHSTFGYPRDQTKAQAFALVASAFGARSDQVAKILPPGPPSYGLDAEQLAGVLSQEILAAKQAQSAAPSPTPAALPGR